MPQKKTQVEKDKIAPKPLAQESNIKVDHIKDSTLNIVPQGDMITVNLSGRPIDLPDILLDIASRNLTPDLNATIDRYVKGILRRPGLAGVDKSYIDLHANCGIQRVPVEELLADHHRLALIGSPGSGKTVLLTHFLELNCKKINVASPEAVRQEIPVPVYIELGLCAQKGQVSGAISNPYRLVIAEVLKGLGIQPGLDPVSLMLKILERWKVLFLLDGLNEVPPNSRELIISGIVAFDQDLANRGLVDRLSVLVTSRSYGFRDLLSHRGYQVAELSPLTLDEIKDEFHKRQQAGQTNPDFSLQDVDAGTRQLLSNPQHLDYYLDWYEQEQQGHPVSKIHRNKAQLFRFFCEQKLAGLPSREVPIIQQVLGLLGYRRVTSSLYFPEAEALHTINEVLEKSKVTYEPDRLLAALMDSGLLTHLGDQLRFSHHSLQQYFAACWMIAEGDFEKYIDHEIWHEPLVIMAGLLDPRRLNPFLRQVRSRENLYAYILANIEQPGLEQAFAQELVRHFTNLTWRWRRQLVITLAVYFLIWFVLLPVLGISLITSETTSQQILLVVLGIGYLALLPYGLISIHKRQTRGRVKELASNEIPRVITPLKLLMAKGALRLIENQLVMMRNSIRNYQPGDPGFLLVSQGINTIRAAINIPNFMSADEMLSNLANPLIAALVETEQVTAQGFDILCSLAASPDNDTETVKALELLSTIFQKDLESREAIIRVLEQIVVDDHYSKRRRNKALRISRELGIELGRSRRVFQDLLHRFWTFMTQLFQR